MNKKFLLLLFLVSVCIFCQETKYDPNDEKCPTRRLSKETCFSFTPKNPSLECCFMHVLDGSLDCCFAMVNEPEVKDYVENSLQVAEKPNKIYCLSDKDPTSPEEPSEDEKPEEKGEEIEEEKQENQEINENNTSNISTNLFCLLFSFFFF